MFNATLMGMMADSVFRLATFLLLAQPNFVAMERTFELLELPTEELLSRCAELETEKETAVEFHGVSFSYGEKKALDSDTEREVQRFLDSISTGMTTVTVAHRLSTIQKRRPHSSHGSRPTQNVVPPSLARNNRK